MVDEVQSAKGWLVAQTEGLHDIKEIEVIENCLVRNACIKWAA